MPANRIPTNPFRIEAATVQQINAVLQRIEQRVLNPKALVSFRSDGAASKGEAQAQGQPLGTMVQQLSAAAPLTVDTWTPLLSVKATLARTIQTATMVLVGGLRVAVTYTSGTHTFQWRLARNGFIIQTGVALAANSTTTLDVPPIVFIDNTPLLRAQENTYQLQVKHTRTAGTCSLTIPLPASFTVQAWGSV